MSVHRLFISSVQKEFATERRAIKDFVEGNELLRSAFDVFLFEALPAADQKADATYLKEVDDCAVYVGILGTKYGSEDSDGLSPTEREFDRATTRGKYRIILVQEADDKDRHPKMVKLISKASGQLRRRKFSTTADLTGELYNALVEFLKRKREIVTVPFAEAPCQNSSLADISAAKVKWFVDRARQERKFPLQQDAPVDTVLTALTLLINDDLTHSAILLFGENPQRFRTLVTAETKCAHFHGTTVQKPIPSHQVYGGTLFDQVDQSVDFVMAKIARAVGTRASGPAVPVAYEIPREVITEAIVNAVAHRDYTSNESVQVMLFADRLEVWNPGELPPNLSLDELRRKHPSIPHNPLIARALSWAHYVETLGTGTLGMIEHCRQAGLPEPTFEQRGGTFTVTIWRDWLTDAVMQELGLSDRQREIVKYVRAAKRITNLECQKQFKVSKPTATRDLDGLVTRKVLRKVGTTGKGTHYLLRPKRLTKGSSKS